MNYNNYKIWCTYHRPEIAQEYNLHESEHFKLFYNDDFNIPEDNINYLHDYLADLGTYYYVWKNNLKSDIVGFCHYSKQFKYVDYERLEKFGYHSIASSFYDANEIINDIFDAHRKYLYHAALMYLKYKYNLDLFQYTIQHPVILSSYHNAYMFKWDIFCDVCDLIFGFLDYIFPNNSWRDKENLDFAVKMHNLNRNEVFDSHAWFPRHISIFYEWLIGLYLGIKYTSVNCNEYLTNNYYNYKYSYFLICKDYIDTIDEAKLWLKQNVKTGITHYVIKSHIPEEIKNAVYVASAGSLLNFYHHKLLISDNEADYTNNINSLINTGGIDIYLNKNERINCDDSIEMHKGYYNIEKII